MKEEEKLRMSVEVFLHLIYLRKEDEVKLHINAHMCAHTQSGTIYAGIGLSLCHLGKWSWEEKREVWVAGSGNLSLPFPRKVFQKAMKGKSINNNMMQIQNKETKKIVENNSKIIYRGETWKRKNVLQST